MARIFQPILHSAGKAACTSSSACCSYQFSFVLPIHDYPARVEHGRVVSRLGQSVPGPETTIEHRTRSETREVVHA